VLSWVEEATEAKKEVEVALVKVVEPVPRRFAMLTCPVLLMEK